MAMEEELRYDAPGRFDWLKMGGWHVGAVGASEWPWRMGLLGKFLPDLGELPITKDGDEVMNEEVRKCLEARSRMVQPLGLARLASAEILAAINTPGDPLNPSED